MSVCEMAENIILQAMKDAESAYKEVMTKESRLDYTHDYANVLLTLAQALQVVSTECSSKQH